MEIRQLRYFLAVAREENMTRASELLHVSQPTLSKTLKALEEELGKKLFTRHSFSIELTDEGMLLRDRAEDLIAMADKIEQEFVSLDDINGGDLYLGLAESYQIRYLARGLGRLKSVYPAMNYHITSGDTEQVTEKLDKGLLDFAVICEPPDERKYNYIEFPETDIWGAVMSADHPLTAKEAVTIDDLIGQPLISRGHSVLHTMVQSSRGKASGYFLRSGILLIVLPGAVWNSDLLTRFRKLTYTLSGTNIRHSLH